VEAFDDLLCDGDRIDEVGVEALAEDPDALGDGIKLDLLMGSIALDHVHFLR